MLTLQDDKTPLLQNKEKATYCNTFKQLSLFLAILVLSGFVFGMLIGLIVGAFRGIGHEKESDYDQYIPNSIFTGMGIGSLGGGSSIFCLFPKVLSTCKKNQKPNPAPDFVL
jgi:hypothetical protein